MKDVIRRLNFKEGFINIDEKKLRDIETVNLTNHEEETLKKVDIDNEV